jgi:hypothetical protein
MGQNYTGKKTIPLTPAHHAPDWRGCLGLKCPLKGAKFWSLGPALRHCPTCKRRLDDQDETRVYDSGVKR